jgi:hypothetical protein
MDKYIGFDIDSNKTSVCIVQKNKAPLKNLCNYLQYEERFSHFGYQQEST